MEFRYCILYNGVGGIDNSIIQQYIGPLLDPHTGIMKPNCNGISHAADPLTLGAAVSMIWIAFFIFRFRGALCDGEVQIQFCCLRASKIRRDHRDHLE